eukprot:COSAG05_NODE_16064_length_354_cov_0.807843_1_plen_47_part_10
MFYFGPNDPYGRHALVEKMPMMALGSAPAGGRHRTRLVRLANQIVTT